MKKEVLQLKTVSAKIVSIEDDAFENEMKTKVEPFLNSVKQNGYFKRESGKNLYYEKYLSPQASQNIVICHGFTENAEKYKEMIYYFYRQNYNVFILDQQGHGRSFRLVEDYSVTHVEKFSDYIEDLRVFMNHIVRPDSQEKPIVLYAHSMGGAIGGAYLEKYPNDFSKAVFTSPMFEINSGQLPKWVGKLIADFKILTGHKTDYLFVHSRFNEKERFEDSCAVSQIRYHYFFQKRLVNKEYQNYCASYSWLNQSIIATRSIVKKQNLSKIQIPVMIFQAEWDTVVKAKGLNKFAKGIADALLVFVPESKHEIFMTQSKILTPYLNKLFEFIN